MIILFQISDPVDIIFQVDFEIFVFIGDFFVYLGQNMRLGGYFQVQVLTHVKMWIGGEVGEEVQMVNIGS